jgi:hypothetical protein
VYTNIILCSCKKANIVINDKVAKNQIMKMF